MGSFKGLKNMIKIIRFHGGIFRTIERLILTDSTHIGHFVGEDEFGNRYYQNDYYFFGRNRFVIYSRKFGYDYDASQISPRYFNWMHHITDIPPDQDPTRSCYHWMLPHTENMTGTNMEFVPYSTVRPKIHPWIPPARPPPPPPQELVSPKPKPAPKHVPKPKCPDKNCPPEPCGKSSLYLNPDGSCKIPPPKCP